MTSSRTLPALLITSLFLQLLPWNCAAMSTTLPSSKIETSRFHGLKALFQRLHKNITERFEDDTVPRIILDSSTAYRSFASRLSAEKQKRLSLQYSQGVGYWQQFQVVAAHVFGDTSQRHPVSYSRAYAAFIDGEHIMVSALPGAGERDRVVERMNILGYTPQEITDVISGRITLHALQQSERMRSLGYRKEAITAYLERQYKSQPGALAVAVHNDMPALRTAAGKVALPSTHGRSEREVLDRHVSRYARDYRIDPDLIRAIIANESSWRTTIRSPVGAIGLMQLMPSTAEMLGVNPLDPEQNIEGGVRYLAALLDMFEGDLDAALVGYNAGPSYARKWRKGGSVLYGETRTYLERVKRSYASQSF